MKKLFMLFAILALSLSFSGCTFFETDTEALMRPPVFTEEQEKLNKALTEVIGESYVLKYPQTGEMNSAFIFKDLDNDGTEEAMAFYSLLDDSTRINILKKEGENWVSVYEAAGFYGEIEKVEFAEMDEKGEAIIIKWEQEAGIYRYESERLESLYRASCEGMDIVDINDDGFEDVVVLSGNPIGKTNVNIAYSNGKDLCITESISINAGYDNIYSKHVGKLSDGETFYFIDSEIYEGVYLTEMVALEEDRAKRYFAADFVEYEDEEPEDEGDGVIVIVGGDYGKRGIFLRNTKAECMDINNDGFVEFPVEYREDYARDASEDIFFIQYMSYDGIEAETVWNGIVNNEEGYLFSVPESWNEKVTVSFGTSAGELVFKETRSGKVILEVCSVMKSDYQDKYEDYILSAEDETKNYYVKIFAEPESEFYIVPETIEKNFIFK